jgi:2-methylcitrate dehydratase PrpD
MNEQRESVAHNVQKLVKWAVGVQAHQIPPQVMARAARIWADDMAAMIGARAEPELVSFHRHFLDQPRQQEATVWCGGAHRTDRISAAVANSVSTNWLELDEGYRHTPCHAGLYVLPALLSEAEAAGLSCRDVLRALVLGYEIVTRIARAWTVDSVTMHSHGRYGAIGAAASVGLARGIDADTLTVALGGAVTLIGPTPRNHLVEGVLIRNAWSASGTWNGIMALEWARCGMGGIPAAFFDVYSTVLLGENWAVQEGFTKIYACCQHLHSAVEAVLDMCARHPEVAVLSQIESITVHTHSLAMPLINMYPSSTLGAKFSMPHAIAVAFAMGQAGAAAFSAKTLTDPTIASLRARVMTLAWSPMLPPPNDRPARVAVRLRDGREFSAECLSASGGPDRPLPEDTWMDKMRELAEPAYPGITEIFSQIVAGDEGRLAQDWSTLVREICQRAAKAG